MARILIVDDEPHIRAVVSAYLERDGHEVSSAGDGDDALAAALADRPDLIVLDVMLPKRSGFDVLRELRAAGSPAAVILLTARDEVVDRVAGLEIGADDYVTKPFEPRELVARVGAVLRRARPNAESPIAEGAVAGATPTTAPSAAPNGLPVEPRRYLDLVIDLAGRDVRRWSASIALTRVEFELLAVLTEHPGVVLDREQLGAAVFGEAFDAFDRTIDSHVKNLRRKLGVAPGDGAYIETVRGVGYRARRAALETRADGPAGEAARVPA